MKEIKLKTTYKPLLLLFQIEPSNAMLCEGTLVCEVEVEGNKFRHDIWWKDMPEETRNKVQELIIEAIDTLMTEESVHTSKSQEGHAH